MNVVSEATLQQLSDGIDNDSFARLRRSLDRTFSGSSLDLRSPLYNSAPREEIIKELEEKVGYTEFEELTALDEHEKGKIGSYSIMLPSSERLSSLLEYWVQSWFPDETALSEAVSRVMSLIPGRSLQPDKLITAFDLMPKGTSLGLPWCTSDKSFAHLYLQRASSLHNVSDIYPAIWYWRGQSQGLHEMPKQRDVWGFDHAETIRGATILYPVLRVLSRIEGFSAWVGDYSVDEAATRIITKARGRSIISGDYSGFDKTLARPLLDQVDNVLCAWFVESASYTIRLLGEISAVVPIVVPYKVLSGRNGGMPSGSVLTNLRDTIANLISGHYCALRLGCTLMDYEVLGDDSVFLFSEDVSPEKYSQVMGELGLDVSPEKQFVSRESLHYLQRWHSKLWIVDGLCVGVHSPYRTLSGMLSYERFRSSWSKYMDSCRWIMQVENCHNDPRFKTFVQFLLDGDKLLLTGIDPKEVFRRAGGPSKIREVLDIASFPFNVKNPEKVAEFETTKILRELRG